MFSSKGNTVWDFLEKHPNLAMMMGTVVMAIGGTVVAWCQTKTQQFTLERQQQPITSAPQPQTLEVEG